MTKFHRRPDNIEAIEFTYPPTPEFVAFAGDSLVNTQKARHPSATGAATVYTTVSWSGEPSPTQMSEGDFLVRSSTGAVSVMGAARLKSDYVRDTQPPSSPPNPGTLVDRLQGRYPVGPTLHGVPEFGWRTFDTFVPPIQREAAARIQELETLLLNTLQRETASQKRHDDKLDALEAAPVPMLLNCPTCAAPHVDEKTEDWDNPPHRSHKCKYCGCIWRPSDVATTGVARITTKGKADNWPPKSGFLSFLSAVCRA